jgi:hypothetical protein
VQIEPTHQRKIHSKPRSKTRIAPRTCRYTQAIDRPKKKHTERISVRSHPPAINLSAVPTVTVSFIKGRYHDPRERSTSTSLHVTAHQRTDHSTLPLSQPKTRLLQHPPPTSSRQSYRLSKRSACRVASVSTEQQAVATLVSQTPKRQPQHGR